MSGLCGWFGGRRDTRDGLIDAMAAPLARFDGGTVRRACASWGAAALCGSRAECAFFADDERMAAVWGRPRLAGAALRASAARFGAARALAEAYRVSGSEVLQGLTGSFALAILDRSSGKALLAVDRTGTRSLCYASAGGALVFGSSLDALDAFPGIEGEIDRQALYDYVHFHMVPAPRTVYVARTRLPAGSYVQWDQGRVTAAAYWRMRFVEEERRPFSELKRDFVSLLRGSVAEAVQGGRAGAFLSGGTDSSTVVGMMRAATGEAPRTYSIGFDQAGFDEIEYARIAARHFATEHHEYYVTPDDVVDAVPRIAALHDQPFGNASAVPTYCCARLARDDGIEILLGGDGGDELFGGNARYAKQYLYSLYSDLPGALRRHVIEPLAFALPDVAPIGKLQRYIRNAAEPMPARYDNYNLLERLGPASVFTAEFLASVDAAEPRAAMHAAYAAGEARTLINRMLAFDLKYTLADNDLPKVARSCELAGLEPRFPMLDDAVVEFAARLAPGLKLRRTQLRYFFKQALRDFLPREIIGKKKHGFGLPFGHWLGAHRPLRQLALDSLSDLKKRLIVRPEFIDELTAAHVARHPGYYGPMVWVLMMLEQWFRAHRPRSAA